MSESSEIFGAPQRLPTEADINLSPVKIGSTNIRHNPYFPLEQSLLEVLCCAAIGKPEAGPGIPCRSSETIDAA